MNKHISSLKTLLLVAIVVAFAWTRDLRAQVNPVDYEALGSWIAFDAPPGREHIGTDLLLQTLRGWKRDALGNLILRKGSGSPRRVIACALIALDSPLLKSQSMATCGCAKSERAVNIRFGSSFMRDSKSEFGRALDQFPE